MTSKVDRLLNVGHLEEEEENTNNIGVRDKNVRVCVE
jgi:hypothetical protein